MVGGGKKCGEAGVNRCFGGKKIEKREAEVDQKPEEDVISPGLIPSFFKILKEILFHLRDSRGGEWWYG